MFQEGRAWEKILIFILEVASVADFEPFIGCSWSMQMRFKEDWQLRPMYEVFLEYVKENFILVQPQYFNVVCFQRLEVLIIY